MYLDTVFDMNNVEPEVQLRLKLLRSIEHTLPNHHLVSNKMRQDKLFPTKMQQGPTVDGRNCAKPVEKENVPFL